MPLIADCDGIMTDVTHHPDPRARHRREHGAPPAADLAAAVRLDLAADAMRARVLAGGPAPAEDEPPTGLIDLAALRAMVGAGGSDEADPAAVAWLAGGPHPAAARVVELVDQLEHDECRCPTLRPGDDCPAHPFDPSQCVPDALPAPVVTVPEPVPATVAPSTGERAPVPAAAVPAPRSVLNMRPRSSNDDPRPGWARGRHDERSLAFGLHDRLGVAPLQDVDLPTGPVLDQGQEGECVGCGMVDAINVLRRTAGRSDLLRIADAAGLYHRAQQLDDVPGENYTGTSVLAGLKAASEAGDVGGYLWAFGTRAIASALAHGRPVVVGVPWLSGMYDAPGGIVAVAGEDRGEGHCLAVVGMRLTLPAGPGPWFRWQNSWGTSYGDRGFAYVHHRDLAALLAGVGEAAVPTLEAQQ